jgi:hypothetical protein
MEGDGFAEANQYDGGLNRLPEFFIAGTGWLEPVIGASLR